MQVRKTFVGLLLCVVVCLSGFVGFTIGQGAAPDFSDYYLDQSVAPYSYMICTDGNGWYWAVNGSNGAVCWTSTNARDTINNVLTNATSGSVIYISGGKYPISSLLSTLTTDDLTILGAGNSTVLYPTTNLGSMLRVGHSSSPINKFTIKNIAFDLDNKITGQCIYGFGSNILIDHVSIENPTFNSAAAVETGIDIQGLNSTNIQITNCKIRNISSYGIICNGGTDNTTVIRRLSNVFITDNYIESTYYNAIGVYGVDYFTISGNIISGSGHSAIAVSPARHGTITGNSISNVARLSTDAIGDAIEAGIEVEHGGGHFNAYSNSSYNIQVTGNVVTNSTCGVVLRSYSATLPLTTVSIVGNTLFGNLQFGIYADILSGCDISKNEITNTTIPNGIGAALTGSLYGLSIKNSVGCNIEGNTIQYTYSPNTSKQVYGIYSAADIKCSFQANIIKDVIVANASYNVYGFYSSNLTSCSIQTNSVFGSYQLGINLDRYCTYNSVSGNTVADNGALGSGGRVGIAVYGDSNTLNFNTCFDTRTAGARTQNYGIVLYSDYTSVSNVLIGNNLYNAPTANLLEQNVANSNTFKNNIGFVTENSFSGANTTATTAVINHGLVSTATYVWVSFNDTAITGYTWASSTTQVTITVTGTLPASWTCYVNAEYKP